MSMSSQQKGLKKYFIPITLLLFLHNNKGFLNSAEVSSKRSRGGRQRRTLAVSPAHGHRYLLKRLFTQAGNLVSPP